MLELWSSDRQSAYVVMYFLFAAPFFLVALINYNGENVFGTNQSAGDFFAKILTVLAVLRSIALGAMFFI